MLLGLAGFLPDLFERLFAVVDRIVDLLPIVRTHIAHPGFLGS